MAETYRWRSRFYAVCEPTKARRQIKWKMYAPTGDVSAQIGNIYLSCWQFRKAKTVDCFASVNMNGITKTRRRGPWRKSMAKAKEDAVRLARELLEDYQTVIDREKKFLEQYV